MIILKLPIKPYSVNKYFYGNRAIKRKEAREWELCILEFLRSKEIQEKLQEFKSKFDSKKNCIHLDIITTYPKDIILTKKDILSSRAFDITNTEKPLVDTLMLNKYCTNAIKNLEIDDKFLTSMTSSKHVAEDFCIYVRFQLVDLQSVQSKLPLWCYDT